MIKEESLTELMRWFNVAQKYMIEQGEIVEKVINAAVEVIAPEKVSREIKLNIDDLGQEERKDIRTAFKNRFSGSSDVSYPEAARRIDASPLDVICDDITFKVLYAPRSDFRDFPNVEIIYAKGNGGNAERYETQLGFREFNPGTDIFEFFEYVSNLSGLGKEEFKRFLKLFDGNPQNKSMRGYGLSGVRYKYFEDLKHRLDCLERLHEDDAAIYVPQVHLNSWFDHWTSRLRYELQGTEVASTRLCLRILENLQNKMPFPSIHEYDEAARKEGIKQIEWQENHPLDQYMMSLEKR